MRINYFSDIHLEFGSVPRVSTDADVIVAAGDIGVGCQGLEWLKSLGKPVIYVAGNHEFYGHDRQEMLAELRAMSVGTDVYFLENDQLIFCNVRFLGCTLWTDLLVDWSRAADLAEILNDFNRITEAGQRFDMTCFSKIHRNSLNWLEAQLAVQASMKTIVVSHHAPTEWSWDGAFGAVKKLAYCNDLRYLFHRYDISAWFHGHVHCLCDYRVAGARVLNNPRGYVGKKLVEGFEIGRVVEI